MNNDEKRMLAYLVKKELERVKKETKTIILPDLNISFIKGENEYKKALKNLLKKLKPLERR